MNQKPLLRARYRKLRREHVATLPEVTRRLLFRRPPAPISAMAPEGSVVALYHALADEAPTRAYAQWLFENGRRIALPWFAGRGAPMQFREWCDPYDDSGLELDPYGAMQPTSDAPELAPALAFVPLLAFTSSGARLGQGGGHYDRWLAAHPDAASIGLGWDCQLADSLPVEPHDQRLDAIITPTRIYEGIK